MPGLALCPPQPELCDEAGPEISSELSPGFPGYVLYDLGKVTSPP